MNLILSIKKEALVRRNLIFFRGQIKSFLGTHISGKCLFQKLLFPTESYLGARNYCTRLIMIGILYRIALFLHNSSVKITPAFVLCPCYGFPHLSLSMYIWFCILFTMMKKEVCLKTTEVIMWPKKSISNSMEHLSQAFGTYCKRLFPLHSPLICL